MNEVSAQTDGQSAPYDKLCAAISILQNHVMASDCLLIGDKLFGRNFMPSLSVEHAIMLLTDIIPNLEHSDRENADD